MVNVHPARQCFPPHGGLPVGSGEGVGDCRDAAISLTRDLLFSLKVSLWEKIMLFFKVWLRYGLCLAYASEYASY